MTDPERTERRPVKIYPWSRSGTGQWDEEQLEWLEHWGVPDLVELFDEKPYAIVNGILEILSHGNIRKAVEISRGLVEVNPAHQARFSTFMDGETMEYWFRKPLEEIPSQPSEMTVPIEYVQ